MRVACRWRWLLTPGMWSLAALLGLIHGPAMSATGAEQPIDFNQQIRPLLANKCLRCHGPDEESREAGLRLDLPAAAATELDSGEVAIVPGQPDQSELLARVTEKDAALRMPPAEAGEPLSTEEVALLRQWIAEGAKFAQHWAYVPPRPQDLPTKLSQPDWVRNDIDRFVLARLDEAGVKPSPAADRYTLIRRLSLDLTGLPPTWEQTEAFVNDKDPQAYEKLVDRLLDSPAYGERWARVWLDLARYADSAGYADDPPRVIWRYRDWVIQAINRNLPYDQFTVQQLAGDLLPDPTEDQLLATAFNRNTMTNNEGGTNDEEFRNVAVVDRVNTTLKVWMGLTMECAQCHTHKYDPITQEEYFRVLAIFNQSADADRKDESPTLNILLPEQEQQKRELEAQLARLEAAVKQFKSEEPKPSTAPTGPLSARFVRVELPGSSEPLSLAEVQVFVGGKNIAPTGKATQVSTAFEGPPQLAIDGNTSGDYFADKSVTHTDKGSDPWWELDLGSPQAVEQVIVWNRTDGNLQARLNGFRVVLLDTQRQPLWVSPGTPGPKASAGFTPPRDGKDLDPAARKLLAAYGAPADPTAKEQQKIDQLLKKLAGIKGVPTPIMRDLPPESRRKTHIQIRGNFLETGKEVTAGLLESFHPAPKEGEINRLTLAQWIIDPANPLTARVTVNRYWEQLFGIGLVETSEDFGVQGEPPSHPALLDHLALGLVQDGWDIKHLLKKIVLSSTYRQSTMVRSELKDRDAANRLLARGPRFRLPAEMVRDQALAVSGLLSSKMLGPSVNPPRPMLGLRAAFGGSTDWTTSAGEDKFRRGLYTTWRRSLPYPSMATFDAPSREVCTVRRVRTNTPLQALVTLNDPVYVEAAQALARRMLAEGGKSDRAKAEFGLRLCLSRPAREAELDHLEKLLAGVRQQLADKPEDAMHLATDPIGPLPKDVTAVDAAAWTVVGNVLLNLDEFLARR